MNLTNKKKLMTKKIGLWINSYCALTFNHTAATGITVF